jgi:N-acetylmuramic acid 6-phosphate (MurNAc-6-P) etherase
MRKTYSLRQALPILVVAVLLTATLVDVVAAGVKAVSRGSRIVYPAAGSSVTVAVPDTVRNFPAELLPQ